MTNKYLGCLFIGHTCKQWRILQLSEQCLSKVVYGYFSSLPRAPIRIVPKAVYAYIFEPWLSGQPLLRPEVGRVLGLAPSLPGPSTKSMYEDEIDKWLWGFVQKIQT